MFGMLDYRAHKLYLILFGLPNLVFSLVTIFGLPLLSYSLGIKFSDVRLWQILISLGLQFLIEILWTLIVTGLIAKVCSFIFSLFVDILPSDGRTKQEAQQVVYAGEKAITLINLDRIHPSQWTDELIAATPKTDWVRNLFYREISIQRFEMLKNYFSIHTHETFNEYTVKKVVKESHLPLTLSELILTSPLYRRMLVLYSFFLYLLVFNPI